MAKIIGRTTNRNDTADIADEIVVGNALSVTLVEANPTRIYVGISNLNKDMFIKLQAATEDNDQKGIFVPRGTFYELPTDNMYTGEISGITVVGSTSVHVTEY